MTITHYFNEFLNFLISEKNVSPHTVKNYSSDFKLFNKFLISNQIQPTLSSIKTPVIRQYVTFLMLDNNYATFTIQRKIHSLSSYYNYLLEQGYITENPMLPIHAPKEPKKLPKYLSKIEKIL